MQEGFRKLRIAIIFLTTFPIPLSEPPKPDELGQSAIWFPLVGLAMGALLYGAGWLLQCFILPLAAAAVLVSLWVVLTGGLHLDGVADCCDAFFLSAPSQRRLEVLHDPHLGTYGAVGLILYLFLKVSLLASLMPLSPYMLLLPPTLARWLLLLAARQPQARQHGLGADFALGLSPRTIWVSALLPLLIIVIGGVHTLLATGLAFLALGGILRLARARLGGVTGDVLGMTVEITELAALLGFAIRF